MFFIGYSILFNCIKNTYNIFYNCIVNIPLDEIKSSNGFIEEDVLNNISKSY